MAEFIRVALCWAVVLGGAATVANATFGLVDAIERPQKRNKQRRRATR